VRRGRLDYGVINKRKEEYEIYEKLTPSRVMTSEREVVAGGFNTGKVPEGALPGITVSSGVVEGRARVVFDFADTPVEDGGILVTKFTD